MHVWLVCDFVRFIVIRVLFSRGVVRTCFHVATNGFHITKTRGSFHLSGAVVD